MKRQSSITKIPYTHIYLSLQEAAATSLDSSSQTSPTIKKRKNQSISAAEHSKKAATAYANTTPARIPTAAARASTAAFDNGPGAASNLEAQSVQESAKPTISQEDAVGCMVEFFDEPSGKWLKGKVIYYDDDEGKHFVQLKAGKQETYRLVELGNVEWKKIGKEFPSKHTTCPSFLSDLPECQQLVDGIVKKYGKHMTLIAAAESQAEIEHQHD